MIALLLGGVALLYQNGYLPLEVGAGGSAPPHAKTRDRGGKLLTNAIVIDGDSMRADGEEIRLLGIDAPELRQTCRDQHGKGWPAVAKRAIGCGEF